MINPCIKNAGSRILRESIKQKKVSRAARGVPDDKKEVLARLRYLEIKNRTESRQAIEEVVNRHSESILVKAKDNEIAGQIGSVCRQESEAAQTEASFQDNLTVCYLVEQMGR